MSTIQSDNLHNDDTKAPKKNPETIDKYGIKDVRIKISGDPNQLHGILSAHAKSKTPLQLWLTAEGNRDIANGPLSGHSVIFVGYNEKTRDVLILNNNRTITCKVDILAKNLQQEIHKWITPFKKPPVNAAES